jgi:gas vesicle protein
MASFMHSVNIIPQFKLINIGSGKLVTTVLAAAGGAALGVLFAPDKGTETRRKISAKRAEYTDKLEEKFEEFKESISEKLESIKSDFSRKTESTIDEAGEAMQTVADEYKTTGTEEYSSGPTL